MRVERPVVNTLTIDVEEYYHATIFQEAVGARTAGLESRVESSTERVLALKDIPDIEEVVAKLAEEIKASTQPRRIRVGSRISDPAAQLA